jgi:hypothetical protein
MSREILVSDLASCADYLGKCVDHCLRFNEFSMRVARLQIMNLYQIGVLSCRLLVSCGVDVELQ